MPSLAGVSLAFPFPLSCRLVSFEARTCECRRRGTKLGLISFIGDKVAGSTSPTAIPFATETSKSLGHSQGTGPEENLLKYSPADIRLILIIPISVHVCQINKLLLIRAVNTLMQETSLRQSKPFQISSWYRFLPFQCDYP